MALDQATQSLIVGRFSAAVATVRDGVPKSTAFKPFMEDTKREFGSDGEVFAGFLVTAASIGVDRFVMSNTTHDMELAMGNDAHALGKTQIDKSGESNPKANGNTQDRAEGALSARAEFGAASETQDKIDSTSKLTGQKTVTSVSKPGRFGGWFRHEETETTITGTIDQIENTTSRKSRSTKWWVGATGIIVAGISIAVLIFALKGNRAPGSTQTVFTIEVSTQNAGRVVVWMRDDSISKYPDEKAIIDFHKSNDHIIESDRLVIKRATLAGRNTLDLVVKCSAHNANSFARIWIKDSAGNTVWGPMDAIGQDASDHEWRPSIPVPE